MPRAQPTRCVDGQRFADGVRLSQAFGCCGISRPALLTFTPGAFGSGDFITFANFAFPSQLPVQFQVDADRVANGQVIVSLSDGSTRTGTFRVNRSGRDENEKGHDDGHGNNDDQKGMSNFTGAGLVNAEAATRPR
jgi:hypothetical protein